MKNFKNGQVVWYIWREEEMDLPEEAKIVSGEFKSCSKNLGFINAEVVGKLNIFETKQEAAAELIRRIDEKIKKLQELAGRLRESVE